MSAYIQVMTKKTETPQADGFDIVLKRMLSTPPQPHVENVKPVKKPKAKLDRPKSKA